MKIKTLLSTVATLVASLMISLANVTVPLPWALNIISNPYNKIPSNRADYVIPYSDGDNIQIWTGSSWQVWTMDSISTTGWIDPNGNDAPLTSLPMLNQAVAFFYGKNTSITSITFSP